VGYSDVHFRLFPKTSSNGADGVAGTADDFAGVDMSNECARNWGLGVPGGTCPWDVVFGVRAGAVFKVSPTVTIGAVYNSPVQFNYRDGRMKLNFSNVGLGRVEYDSAVDGFKWPQSVEAGIAWRPTPRWLLGLDFAWHDWSTFNRLVITASNPDTPGAPARVRIPVEFDWHDQWVVSVGAAYEVVPDVLTLRGGYNFGNNQVPDRTLSPTVCVIYEHHLTAGAGYRPGRNLQLDLAFAYTLENKVTYTNRGQPFGANAVSAPAGLHVDLTLGYRF
jgi:long-chain fatty acid transport protein